MARIQQKKVYLICHLVSHGYCYFFILILRYISCIVAIGYSRKKNSLPPTPSQDGKDLFIPSLRATPFLVARHQSVPSDKIASKVSVGGKALSDFWRTTKFSFQLGHFWVPQGLCIKTRLSAQPLIWKWFFIRMQIKLIVPRKVVHLVSIWKWGFFGTQKWSIVLHLLVKCKENLT